MNILAKAAMAFALSLGLVLAPMYSLASSSSGASVSGGGKWGGRGKGYSAIIIMMDDMGSNAFTMIDSPYNQKNAYTPTTGGYTSSQLPYIQKALDNGINFKGMRPGVDCASTRNMLRLNQALAANVPLAVMRAFDPSIKTFHFGKDMMERPSVSSWRLGNATGGQGFTREQIYTHPDTTTTTVSASSDSNLYTKNGFTWAATDDLAAMAALQFINTDVYASGPDTFWANEKAPVYLATLGMHTPHKPWYDTSNVVNGALHPSAAMKTHWATSQTWGGGGGTPVIGPFVPDQVGEPQGPRNLYNEKFLEAAVPVGTGVYPAGYGAGNLYPVASFPQKEWSNSSNAYATWGCPTVDPGGSFPGPWDTGDLALLDNSRTLATISLWESTKSSHNCWLSSQILLDRMVGRLIEGIGAKRLEDVSIIITGDNGSIFAGVENANMYGWSSNAPNLADTNSDMDCNWRTTASCDDESVTGGTGTPGAYLTTDAYIKKQGKGSPFAEVPWIVAYGPVSAANRGSASEVLLNMWDVPQSIIMQVTDNRLDLASDAANLGPGVTYARDYGPVFNADCGSRSAATPMVVGCDNPGNNFTIRLNQDNRVATHAMMATGELYDLYRSIAGSRSPTGLDYFQDVRSASYWSDLRAGVTPLGGTPIDDAYDAMNAALIAAGGNPE